MVLMHRWGYLLLVRTSNRLHLPPIPGRLPSPTTACTSWLSFRSSIRITVQPYRLTWMMGISQMYPDVTICIHVQQRESKQTTEWESSASPGHRVDVKFMPNSSRNFFIVSNSSSCPVLSAGIAHTGLTLPAGASEWNQAVCGSVRQFKAVDASGFRR